MRFAIRFCWGWRRRLRKLDTNFSYTTYKRTRR